jgi:hypothetical protein
MGKSFGETAIAFHMVLRAKYALLLSKVPKLSDFQHLTMARSKRCVVGDRVMSCFRV